MNLEFKLFSIHNRPLPKQVQHVVVDEVVNDELVKDTNPISLNEGLGFRG
jgi:hypothetical protein